VIWGVSGRYPLGLARGATLYSRCGFCSLRTAWRTFQFYVNAPLLYWACNLVLRRDCIELFWVLRVFISPGRYRDFYTTYRDALPYDISPLEALSVACVLFTKRRSVCLLPLALLCSRHSQVWKLERGLPVILLNDSGPSLCEASRRAAFGGVALLILILLMVLLPWWMYGFLVQCMPFFYVFIRRGQWTDCLSIFFFFFRLSAWSVSLQDGHYCSGCRRLATDHTELRWVHAWSMQAEECTILFRGMFSSPVSPYSILSDFPITCLHILLNSVAPTSRA